MTVHSNFRKAFVAIGGGILVLLGLAGFALPILPGAVFLIAGLFVWSSEFSWAKRLLVRVRGWMRSRSSRRKDARRSLPAPPNTSAELQERD